MKIDYEKTLNLTEEIKVKLNALNALLYTSVNQELSNTYEFKKDDLINWIEEIEFTIISYNN